MFARTSLIWLCLAAWPAAGEPLPAAPDQAAAAVPPLSYPSVFEGYRRFEPVPRLPWRAANEAVGAPAAPGRAVEAAPAPGPAAPPAGGHAGHRH